MIDRFIEHISAELRYSELTVKNYRRDLEHFATWWCSERGFEAGSFENFDVTAVTAQDVSDWVLYRIEVGKLAAATMNRELSSIKSFFRFLRSKDIVKSDILKRIGSLKAAKVLPVFVPQSRMEEMLESVEELSYERDFRSQRDSIIISLLYGCGIRLAELLGIKVGHISGGAVKILGKGGKERIVPLLPELTARIARYTAVCRQMGIELGSESKLIVGSKGKPLSRSTVQRVVANQMQLSGIQGRKSPHVLRHTFATDLLRSGADMREIQELMGHSSLRSTQHYTHTSISQLQDAYDKAHPHK
ncbi:MAG: tyrosine-type recombinase/integrase [Alistipes sp.]|nr:tyrosine-type recombinase/integrase [Alistipes sp.]